MEMTTGDAESARDISMGKADNSIPLLSCSGRAGVLFTPAGHAHGHGGTVGFLPRMARDWHVHGESGLTFGWGLFLRRAVPALFPIEEETIPSSLATA